METTETKPLIVEKKETKTKELPTQKLGNLTKFQDKERIVKVAKRDPSKRSEIIQTEIKATEYTVGVEYDKNGKEVGHSRLKFVEETFDGVIVKNRTYLDEAVLQETIVKDFPLAIFEREGKELFCQNIGFGEWSVNPNIITPTHIYILLRDIDEKFIEQRFEHLLEKANGGLLTGVAKKVKIKSLLEKFKSLRVGNTIIKAENILHLPNFDDSIKITDM